MPTPHRSTAARGAGRRPGRPARTTRSPRSWRPDAGKGAVPPRTHQSRRTPPRDPRWPIGGGCDSGGEIQTRLRRTTWGSIFFSELPSGSEFCLAAAGKNGNQPGAGFVSSGRRGVGARQVRLAAGLMAAGGGEGGHPGLGVGEWADAEEEQGGGVWTPGGRGGGPASEALSPEAAPLPG